MPFSFIESLKNPMQIMGLAPGAKLKKEKEIPTWLIILITLFFIVVVGWFLINL
jgi:hypothetical protein